VEGRLLLCLGNEHSVDLKAVLRSHPGQPERLEKAIIEAMKLKPYRAQLRSERRCPGGSFHEHDGRLSNVLGGLIDSCRSPASSRSTHL
jgi:molybdenum cofactor biosynthesis enzyme MoaA